MSAEGKRRLRTIRPVSRRSRLIIVLLITVAAFITVTALVYIDRHETEPTPFDWATWLR